MYERGKKSLQAICKMKFSQTMMHIMKVRRLPLIVVSPLQLVIHSLNLLHFTHNLIIVCTVFNRPFSSFQIFVSVSNNEQDG